MRALRNLGAAAAATAVLLSPTMVRPSFGLQPPSIYIFLFYAFFLNPQEEASAVLLCIDMCQRCFVARLRHTTCPEIFAIRRRTSRTSGRGHDALLRTHRRKRLFAGEVMVGCHLFNFPYTGSTGTYLLSNSLSFELLAACHRLACYLR